MFSIALGTAYGTFLTHENDTLIIGILIVAFVFLLGTALILIGNGEKNKEGRKEITLRIEKIQGQLDVLNQKPILTEKDSGTIVEMEAEVLAWAEKFDAQSMELEVRGLQAEKATEDIKISKEYRPVYVSFFRIFDEYLKALKLRKSKYEIVYDLPTVPVNIVNYSSSKTEGTITFDSKVKWTFRFQMTVQDELLPSINIFIEFYEKNVGFIMLCPVQQKAFLMGSNDPILRILKSTSHLFLRGMKDDYLLVDHEKTFNNLCKTMLEQELAQL